MTAGEKGVRAVGRTCTIEGCDRPVQGRGWCGMHYKRWLRHGDPLFLIEQRRYDPLCSIEGCEQPHHARGWCQKHHWRWLRHGDPLIVKRPTFRRVPTVAPRRPRLAYAPGVYWCDGLDETKLRAILPVRTSSEHASFDADCSSVTRRRLRLSHRPPNKPVYDDGSPPFRGCAAAQVSEVAA